MLICVYMCLSVFMCAYMCSSVFMRAYICSSVFICVLIWVKMIINEIVFAYRLCLVYSHQQLQLRNTCCIKIGEGELVALSKKFE